MRPWSYLEHLPHARDVIRIGMYDVNKDGVGGIEAALGTIVAEVETLIAEVRTGGI